MNPRMKLIAILRDPVDRALSHYQHEVRHGVEPLTSEEAIETEPLAADRHLLLEPPHYLSYNHHRSGTSGLCERGWATTLGHPGWPAQCAGVAGQCSRLWRSRLARPN